METLLQPSLVTGTPFSSVPDARVGNDHEIAVAYNFPAWYKCYRHATIKDQHRMENDLQTVLRSYPELALKRDNRGDLPIHHILAEDHGSVAPVQIRLLATLLQIQPDSVREVDSNGLLPLHLACRYGGHWSYDIVECLIKCWPDALKVKVNLSKNKKDMLPLHIACEFGPLPSNIITLLSEHYPVALMTRNGDGNLPLHIACRGYDVSTSTVKFLYKAFPGAIRIPNVNGELPLHIVCGRRSIHAHDVIKVLLSAYPESIQVKNYKGELPLHYACNGLQPLDVVRFLASRFQGGVRSSDVNGMLPLHHSCKSNSPLIDVIEFLINEYPESLSTREKDGYLPLHYACRFGAIDAIKYFVHMNPESAKDNNNKDKILPIQIICQSKKPSPAAAKILGSAFPKSLKTLCDEGLISLNMAKAYYSSETLQCEPEYGVCCRMDIF